MPKGTVWAQAGLRRFTVGVDVLVVSVQLDPSSPDMASILPPTHPNAILHLVLVIARTILNGSHLARISPVACQWLGISLLTRLSTGLG